MVAGAATAAAALPAEAAPVRRFDIAPKTYSEALIDLALQANVSLLGASACRGTSRAGLHGDYTVEDALQRLLAGAPCRYRLVGDNTIRITAAPLAAPVRASPKPTTPPQTGAQAVTPLLTEITVTAAKRRQPADQLAGAISVIGAEELRITSASDAGEASGQISGLLTTNLGPGRDKILLRGVSDGGFSGRTRSTVATVLDDAPLNYAAPDPDLRLTDVDRVEVIRGPQGALYGAGAMSGVYRIVSRKPDLKRLRAGVQASYADTADGAPSSVVEGYVSVPLVEDRLGVRLAAYDEKRGGFLDNAELRQADVDSTRRRGVRLSSQLVLTPDWTVDVSGVVQDLKSDDSQYSTAPGFWRGTGVAERHDNHFGQAAVSLRGRLPMGELTAVTSFVRHSFRSQYDATAAFEARGEPVNIAVFREPMQLKMVTQEVFLSSPPAAGPVSWLAGVYVARSDESSTPILFANWPGYPPLEVYRELRKERMDEQAIYGEFAWSVQPDLILSVGARAFDTRLKVRSDVVELWPANRQMARELSYTGLSSKVSLQRRLGGGDMVYLLYSEGYRPGGLNTSGIFAPDETWAEYESDRLHNIEIGGRLTGRDNRLSLQGALFFERWNEIQSNQFLWPSGFYYGDNVGDADLLGLEFEGSYDFDWGLSVKGNALVTESRVTDPNTSFALQVVRDLPGTPKFSGGLLAVYERPLGARDALRLIADVSYVGRSNLSFDAALSPRMGDFFRTRLAVQYAASFWTAEVSVSNPFNSSANTFAYGNPWSLGLINQATPLRPRTVGVTLSAAY